MKSWPMTMIATIVQNPLLILSLKTLSAGFKAAGVEHIPEVSPYED